MKHLNFLNLIFFCSLTLIVLIALGLLPRQFAFSIAAAYLAYVIFAPLEKGIALFLRSIPFFIALPLTASFDNFNTWRIVLFAIFIKWLLLTKLRIITNIQISLTKSTIVIFVRWARKVWHDYRIECLGLILFVLAIFSLTRGSDLITGIKRIIYFANLAMLFVIVRHLVSKDKENLLLFAKNILIGAILVLGFGYLQLLSVYFVPIDVWHQWWGKQISLGFYGERWSDIVMRGNTWFSYTAGSLKLRMFSTFPDSHSFPLYLLMVLPFFLAISFHKYWGRIFGLEDKKWIDRLKKKAAIIKDEPRAWDLLIFIVFLNLALILSGTRGVWVSIIFPILFCVLLIIWHKLIRRHLSATSTNSAIAEFVDSIWSWLQKPLKILLLFLLLFPLASLLWSFPQFQLEKTPNEDKGAFIERIKSSFSVEETSNLGRIYIWKETLRSLLEKPLFGVGIGNYPVVLDQDVALAKAGSSAHNLYFNVAAEMGLMAGVIFLWFLFEILRSAWRVFKKSDEPWLKIFGISSIVFLLWVYGYSLTDSALFDERTFLIFMALTGIIVGDIIKKGLH